MTTIDIKLPKRLQDQLTMPPCVDFRLPKPTLPELTLPTGGTLKGVADLTKGVPTDCSLNFNLIIQLAPILASMQCLFEVLKLLGALKKFFEAAKGDVFSVPSAAGETLQAFEGVAKCISFPLGTGAFLFVRDLLRLIAKILGCLGQQLKSLARILGPLQLQIRSAEAAGNRDLLATLNCAKENAQRSAEGAMLAIEPITLVLGMAEPFLGIAGVSPIELPSVGALEDAQAIDDAADALLTVAATLTTIADGVPVPS